MFHGAGQARPPFVIVAEIVSQKLFHGVILGVCAVFVRFRYARSVPPLLFLPFLRFACVVLLVVFVLRLKIKRICDDRIKLDKIYGFPFFVRLRACFGACLVLASVRACRPSIWQGAPVPIKQNRPYPLYYLLYLRKKIFYFLRGKI